MVDDDHEMRLGPPRGFPESVSLAATLFDAAMSADRIVCYLGFRQAGARRWV